MILSILLLIIGLIILVIGAEGLVRGASSLSRKAGISTLVIGLTVVALGTSAPELAVNIIASLNGTSDVAVGNIVGSNIANLLLILGAAGLFATLKVKYSTTWREIPFALLAVVVLLILGSDVFLDGGDSNLLTRIDGLVLISFFTIFTFYTFILARSNRGAKNDEEEIKLYNYPLSILLIIAGLGGLVFGGQLLVDNAVSIALSLGMSEMLVGLTVVAIGTSLPELATCITAVRKGQVDMAVGNVIGSNIFNVLWILGLSSTILPAPISEVAQFDIAFTIVITLLVFLLLFIGRRHQIQRWQSALLLVTYIGYLTFSIIRG